MSTETPRSQEMQEGNYLPANLPDAQLTEVTYWEQEVLYPYHRDPAYRPWVLATLPKKPTHYQEILTIMRTNVSHAVLASWISLAFALTIVADFTLPMRTNEVKVTGYDRSPAGTYQMKLSDGSVINVSKKIMRTVSGDFLSITRTNLFGIPYRITDREKHVARVEISIYGNFIFMPLSLLLTSLVGAGYKKGFELRYNLGVASSVLVFLNIAFLFIHRF
ncbi:MAG: hypothetical protein QM734_16755 [Cyclobacteriaceae bacterium]